MSNYSPRQRFQNGKKITGTGLISECFRFSKKSSTQREKTQKSNDILIIVGIHRSTLSHL